MGVGMDRSVSPLTIFQKAATHNNSRDDVQRCLFGYNNYMCNITPFQSDVLLILFE